MKRLFFLVPALLMAAAIGNAATGTSAQTADCNDCVHLNHVQVLGTHNSYHIEPYPGALDVIAQIDPNAALSFEYSHRPLAEQLGVLGIRQVELDVFTDPGPLPLFAAPIGEVLTQGPVQFRSPG